MRPPVRRHCAAVTRAKAQNLYIERSRGFEAGTERGTTAFTRRIRLKTRSPGLKSGAGTTEWHENNAALPGQELLSVYPNPETLSSVGLCTAFVNFSDHDGTNSTFYASRPWQTRSHESQDGFVGIRGLLPQPGKIGARLGKCGCSSVAFS
jgi:hypothetical protein